MTPTDDSVFPLKDILTIGISAAAFVSAAMASWLSLTAQANSGRSEARRAFNEICIKIAELIERLKVLQAEQRTTENLSLYNTKVEPLIQRIVALAALGREVLARSGVKASTPEYALLAERVALSGDPAAGDLWRNAVAAARTNHDRTDVNQRLGGYLYSIGDAAAGADAYGRAETAMKPATTFMIGRNRQLEGMARWSARDVAGSRARLGEARRHYEAMPEGAQRDYALNSLNEVTKALFGEAAV